MADRPRLIEVAFPLKETSIDSVHEKDIRSGHISSIHVWPARRPLAASRAALIATLLPDPGNEHDRRELCEKIGGRLHEGSRDDDTTVVAPKDVTEGGVLRWGRESSPEIDWFREKIREAYGDRAPRVLDPFSGGGAIPLEAMRLGCEVTALDINPVAWFILKCTLEYTQRFAGKLLRLPVFTLDSDGFANESHKPIGRRSNKASAVAQLSMLGAKEADMVSHVRVWGRWVLKQAREDLARFYPQIEGRTPVAYLWARTVQCKDCRATVPLLKTRWLARTTSQRVLLVVVPKPDKSGVSFEIETNVPVGAGSASRRKEHDKELGRGTMSKSGATCPCCKIVSTMDDLRLEGQADRLGLIMTAVATEGVKGKVFRAPTLSDVDVARDAEKCVPQIFADVPFGVPDEAMPCKGALGFRVPLYGIDKWSKLYTGRQLVALGTFVRAVRRARERMREHGVPDDWAEAIVAYLACAMDRMVDFSNMNAQWKIDRATVNHALVRFAVQMTWDFAEANTTGSSAGSFELCLERVLAGVASVLPACSSAAPPTIIRGSATDLLPSADVIITDPPYYDAIPYSDLMDWFYVWLRRTVYDLSDTYRSAMSGGLAPKWDESSGDGELIEDANRHAGNVANARRAYEDGMARVFGRCADALDENGRLVVVFANKQPDAWESLVSSIVRAGFMIEASWPIETEQRSRTRGQSSAALSSSIWLVARRRPVAARPGWDNKVLENMRERIYSRLHGFWDAGTRGPDFVWAATGPALEAYSKHPVVKKANDPGQVMTVSEFLRQVRRIVVDFVVGRVLTGDGSTETATGLDDVTTYYLLHRHDFGLAEAPVGASILYAVSCGLSDRDLSDRYDLLTRTGGKASAVEEEPDDETEEDEGESEPAAGGGSGNKVKLRAWDQRRGKNLGVDVEGRPAPLVDKVHRLMHLWRTGDQTKVNEYLDAHTLWRSPIFHQFLQAIIELSPEASDERAILESLSNHVGAPGKRTPARQIELPIAANKQKEQG